MTSEIKTKTIPRHVSAQMERILASYMPRGGGLWRLQWISEISCELSFEIKLYFNEKSDVKESIPLPTKWLVVSEGKVHGRTVRVSTLTEH